MLPKEEQYIHKCSSEEGFDVIVTMLPGLANYVHTASATLHDNTYARLHGNWKAWDAIIWLARENMRKCHSVLASLYSLYYLTGICFARVYCTHETVEAFSFMWSALWDTIEVITGSPVKFKFIHGEGIKAICVDGSKPQMLGCGKDLIKRNDPSKSGINECDPLLIVSHIARTCFVHLDR